MSLGYSPDFAEYRRIVHRRYDDNPDYVVYRGAISAVYRISTLRDLSKIEALRWRIVQAQKRLWDKRGKLNADIIAAGGAFIPQSNYPRWPNDPDPPRRLEVSPGWGGRGPSVNYQDHFWDAPVIKRGDHALEELAEIGAEVEWEEELARRLALVTPDQLELGQQYVDMERQSERYWYRMGIVSDAIEYAVSALGVIPKAPNTYDKQLNILKLNGRLYPFTASCYDVKGERKDWPTAYAELRMFTAPDTYEVDQSLIGLDSKQVTIRLGAPDKIIRSRGAWVYGDNYVIIDNDYLGIATAVLTKAEYQERFFKKK